MVEITFDKLVEIYGPVGALAAFIFYILKEFRFFMQTELENCEKRYAVLLDEVMRLKDSHLA